MINIAKQEQDVYSDSTKQNQLPKLSLLATAIKVAIVGLSMVHSAGQAATIAVDSNLDNGSDCTLRDAVTSVNNGVLEADCVNSADPFGSNDTINVAAVLASDTILLVSGQLEINPGTSVEINGNGVTVDANQQSPVFVTQSAILSIHHMTITGGSNGRYGGGIYANDSSVSISYSILSGNSATSGGAGIDARDNSSVGVNNSVFSDNNVSSGSGGGITVANSSIVSVNNSEFFNNSTAAGFGAALNAFSSSSISLMNSRLSGNSAVSGAGIYARQASVSVSNSTVSDNTATYNGGGIYTNGSADLTLSNSTVSGNSAGRLGGGIFAPYFSPVNLANSTVSGNTAGRSGGGISAVYFSPINLNNSTVSGNTAGRNGGGVFATYFSPAILSNSTVSGNSAVSDGGGIHSSESSVTLTNSTVSDNAGSSGGGISVTNDSNVTLSNSIVANSLGADCSTDNSTATATADSIIEDGSCGTTAMAIDPLLGPLADNGGPTQTHALFAGSLAIDNGTGAWATATDQRGVAAQGVRDSGAYEFTAANNALSIEKLINNRARETLGTAAQLLTDTHYRAEYKVTNNSPDRLYEVQVFEGGQLVCDLYGLNPGQSKQASHCANNQTALLGSNNVAASVTAKVSGSSQELSSHTNAYYNGLGDTSGELTVTHYVNERNADTQAKAVALNGNQAEVLFRIENTGSIELYRVNTFHDPASPVNSGWQQQCLIGTLLPGQVRYCKRTISVTQEGLNIAFGRAQGKNANVGNTGFVNASNPTYFNVVVP